MAKMKCPKCRSTNVQIMGSTKKPLSAGKAVAGGLLLGPLGAIGGAALGKKGKYEMFCNDCGERWKQK